MMSLRVRGFIHLIPGALAVQLHRHLATVRLHDELRTALMGEIRPYRLCPDSPPVSRSREKRNVNKSPHQPRREPAQRDNTGIQNGEAAPNHGHVAFVDIAEWWWRGTPGLALGNHVAHEAPLLHGHLRDPGQWCAILLEGRRVADDEDLRIAWHTTIWLHAYASGPVGRRLQPGA